MAIFEHLQQCQTRQSVQRLQLVSVATCTQSPWASALESERVAGTSRPARLGA